MSRPLDHHHLPIFYLSGWCGPDGKVVRYWRPNGREVKPSPIAPKNTGYEPLLYSLDGYPEDQQQVIEEKFFGPVVDEPASRALKVLIELGPLSLTDEMRVAWTRFLMAARVRGPEMIKKIQNEARRDMDEALLRDPHEYDAVRRDGGPSTLLELAEQICKPRIDNSGKIVLPGVIQHPKFSGAIIRMKWVRVDLSTAKDELLTSDQPLVMTAGLDDQRCIIAFPLHPRFAFVATNDREMEHRLRNLTVDAFATAINESVVNQAERYVYGRTDAQLAFVERMLQRHPG
jgi:hypothetical protein